MSPAGFSLHSELDEPRIAQLQALHQGEWWTEGRSLEGVRRMLAGSDLAFALLREADGQLVAFARVLTDGVYKALVFDVIVAAELRGKGLGETLMGEVLAHPDVAAAAHVELYCLPDVIPFYERWGFGTEISGMQFLRRAQA